MKFTTHAADGRPWYVEDDEWWLDCVQLHVVTVHPAVQFVLNAEWIDVSDPSSFKRDSSSNWFGTLQSA